MGAGGCSFIRGQKFRPSEAKRLRSCGDGWRGSTAASFLHGFGDSSAHVHGGNFNPAVEEPGEEDGSDKESWNDGPEPGSSGEAEEKRKEHQRMYQVERIGCAAGDEYRIDVKRRAHLALMERVKNGDASREGGDPVA